MVHKFYLSKAIERREGGRKEGKKGGKMMSYVPLNLWENKFLSAATTGKYKISKKPDG